MKFTIFQTLDDQPVFVRPDKVIALATAYQPSTIAQGQMVPVGTMLIIEGGAQFPVCGHPNEIMEALYPTEH